MSVVPFIHEQYVHRRRVNRLRDHLAEMIPTNARVLDVGCGDGLLARLLMQKRPDIAVHGVDVLVRGETHIPIEGFDGKILPYGPSSFDVVMFVDVLHHTQDPMILLREAVRVARKAIVIKDHTRNGLFAGTTLRAMDWLGNARHGVALPYNYWSRSQWLQGFDALGIRASVWKKDLHLYPWPADCFFGRSLHFVARLEHNDPTLQPTTRQPAQ